MTSDTFTVVLLARLGIHVLLGMALCLSLRGVAQAVREVARELRVSRAVRGKTAGEQEQQWSLDP